MTKDMTGGARRPRRSEPSHPLPIHVDRLEAAMATEGLVATRSGALRLAAAAYGYRNDNEIAAASKRGDLDLPSAPPSADGDATGLIALMDPRTGRAFAVDPDAVRDGVVVSPYGGLLRTTASIRATPVTGELGSKSIGYVSDGIPIGTDYAGEMIRANRDESVLCVAPTGSGKTTRVAIPWARSVPRRILVVQERGDEVRRATIANRAALGDVRIVAPERDEGAGSKGLNPFSKGLIPRDPSRRKRHLNVMARTLVDGSGYHWTRGDDIVALLCDMMTWMVEGSGEPPQPLPEDWSEDSTTPRSLAEWVAHAAACAGREEHVNDRKKDLLEKTGEVTAMFLQEGTTRAMKDEVLLGENPGTVYLESGDTYVGRRTTAFVAAALQDFLCVTGDRHGFESAFLIDDADFVTPMIDLKWAIDGSRRSGKASFLLTTSNCSGEGGICKGLHDGLGVVMMMPSRSRLAAREMKKSFWVRDREDAAWVGEMLDGCERDEMVVLDYACEPEKRMLPDIG